MGTPTDGKDLTINEAQPTYAELRAWCGTVRHGNFAQAARNLGLKPVTVQLLIRSLGEKVRRLLGPDAKLYVYDASTRQTKATDIGQKLYEWADAAVANIDRTEEFIKGSLRASDKSLRVAANLALWEHQLLECVGKIREAEPEVAIEMYSRGSSGSLALMRSHQCHVAFVAEPVLTEARPTLPDRVRQCEYATYDVELVIPCNSELTQDATLQHALSQARTGDTTSSQIVLQRIYEARPLILPGRWSSFRQQLDSIFAKYGMPLQPQDVHTFDVGRCILAAVAANLGITIQQHVALEPTLEQKITRITLRGIISAWPVYAVWDPLYMTEPARELIRQMCKVEP